MSHAFINLEGVYILEVSDGIFIDASPVAELERERIIKLLDKFAYPKTEPVYEMDETQWAIAKGQIHQYRRELVALIKGENQKDNETVSLLTEGENKLTGKELNYFETPFEGEN